VAEAEGIFYSGTLADDQDVSKGDVAHFNWGGDLVQATNSDTDVAGVFAEDGDTTGDDDSQDIAIVVHGVAGVTAPEAISAGEAVRPSETDDGEVDPLPDPEDVSTGQIHHNLRLGHALEDIAASEVGDVFVNVTPAGEDTA